MCVCVCVCVRCKECMYVVVLKGSVCSKFGV